MLRDKQASGWGGFMSCGWRDRREPACLKRLPRWHTLNSRMPSFKVIHLASKLVLSKDALLEELDPMSKHGRG